MGRVGIRQVANAAGVSATTVSHALSGKGRVPEATRERVRRVASELGYRPSAPARHLAAGTSGVLGVAVADVPGAPFVPADFAYFVELLAAATRAALAHGYALVLAPGGGEDTGWRDALDGALVVDPVLGDPRVEEMRAAGVPVVTTGRVPDGPDAGPWVDNDHPAGACAVLDHLAAGGARRVALLSSPPVTSYARDVEAAYRAWCAERSAPAEVVEVGGGLTEGEAYAAAGALLDSPDPPDAIYAGLDRLALGALLAAEARGVPVPEALAVAACTDSDAGRRARPPLTVLALHPEEIARRAVDLLVALVEGRDPGERRVVVPTRLLPRGSTRPV